MATRTYDVEVPEFEGDLMERVLAEDEWVGRLTTEGIANYETTGSIKGVIWRHQIADGYAFYKVESERPLKLAHIPIGDKWHAPDYAVRGLTKADIEKQLVFDIKWRGARRERLR